MVSNGRSRALGRAAEDKAVFAFVVFEEKRIILGVGFPIMIAYELEVIEEVVSEGVIHKLPISLIEMWNGGPDGRNISVIHQVKRI